MGLLSLLIGLPLLGMLLTLFIPGKSGHAAKWLTLAVTLAQATVFFTAILPAYLGSDPATEYHLVEQVQWLRLDVGAMGILNIEYHLGIDGLGLAMVLIGNVVVLRKARSA